MYAEGVGLRIKLGNYQMQCRQSNFVEKMQGVNYSATVSSDGVNYSLYEDMPTGVSTDCRLSMRLMCDMCKASENNFRRSHGQNSNKQDPASSIPGYVS